MKTNGSGTGKKRRNERDAYLTKLYILMTAIAVLLGGLLLLMPERPADDAETVERVPQAESERDAESESAVRDPTAPGPEPRSVERDFPEDPRIRPTPEPPVRGRLSIVIDDVGNDVEALSRFLDVPAEITFAVLPRRRYSTDTAAMIAEAGKEAILHLPMEPVGDEDPGAGAVLVSLSEREIDSIIEENLRTVPGVVGVNNHMGSRATADPVVMDAVLTSVGRRGLFFLDSRTSAETVGSETASRLGVPHIERTVFLDNDPNPEVIEAQIRRGMELAARHGHAVLIGHVTVPALADVLIELYPELVSKGFELLRLSDLVMEVGGEHASAGN
jgi:hypothetical protein